MRVSFNWLQEYVDCAGLTPNEVAEALTNSGLEVEAVEPLGGNFSNVVAAKCLKLEQHPNADKLRLATVSIGKEECRVVCGAQNLAEGMMIAFAKTGAQVINRKDGTPFVLGPAVIRGVESSGMICSIDELGLQDRYPKMEDGIWPIADYATESDLGRDLKDVLGLQDDTILHTAPTANRGDQMSMLGVAREVAALFNRTLKLPDIKLPEPAKSTALKVALPEPELASYYGGLVMKNIQIKPSPDWLTARLTAAGVRVINNVVDITNYVMLEMGQPLHAFDLAKFGDSGTISVRRAKDQEKLITLDEVERTLTETAVVIDKDGKAVAFGGVMGGLTTEIDEQSKALLLESACFDAANNRKCAKSVALRTEASARFERGVDPAGSKQALLRAAQLIQELASGEVVDLCEAGTLAAQVEPITLRLSRLEQIIGLAFEKQTVIQILEPLGFKILKQDQTSLQVEVPTYRQYDVTREIDVIEEVIRIYGYDKIPYTLPRKTASVSPNTRGMVVNAIHNTLQGLGLQPVMTTSLVGVSLLSKTGFTMDEKALVSVNNSHSADHTQMRQSLLPNLVDIAKFNQSFGIDAVWIYELGKTYFKVAKAGPKQTGVNERLTVSGLISGAPQAGEWHQKQTTDFYTAKGLVENLLKRLLPDIKVEFKANTDSDNLHPGRTASILTSDNKELGLLGQLHPGRQQALKLKNPIFVFELNVETILKLAKSAKATATKTVLSSYQAVQRDVALLAPVSLPHQQILEVMSTLDGNHKTLLRNIELFDEYRDAKLGDDKRSLAYRLTFQSDTETLTDAVIDQAVAAIKQNLDKHPEISLR